MDISNKDLQILINNLIYRLEHKMSCLLTRAQTIAREDLCNKNRFNYTQDECIKYFEDFFDQELHEFMQDNFQDEDNTDYFKIDFAYDFYTNIACDLRWDYENDLNDYIYYLYNKDID